MGSAISMHAEWTAESVGSWSRGSGDLSFHADRGSSQRPPALASFLSPLEPIKTMWIADRYRSALEDLGLADFDAVMNSACGRCLRVLADRENWYLPGMYLKKHRFRSWSTRIAAALGASVPTNPGRGEAENARSLQESGIDVMPLIAYGEKLHADGRLESFLLSQELAGYRELQDFIQRRFPSRNRARLSPILRRLIVQVANIARRFHAAGFNHRDFYCCHFLVKEIAAGECDVRLIDLQRVQRRVWFRRRWIIKDLAQLASMSPDDHIGCREKVLFLRTYLGVRKLRTADKGLVRAVLEKAARIRRRTDKVERPSAAHCLPQAVPCFRDRSPFLPAGDNP